MQRRSIILLSLGLPTLTSCYYPQYFYTSWDEEVKLHDGSVIVIKLKFKFERRSRFKEYDDIMLRDTTMTFDAGPPFGVVTQEFRQMQPTLLNKYEDTWYAVIVPRGGGFNYNLTGQDWGSQQQNASHQAPIKLTAEGFKWIQLSQFPDAIVTNNMLQIDSFREMVSQNGRSFQLGGSKAELARKYFVPHENRILSKSKLGVARPKITEGN